MTKTTTGAHRAISHSSWQTTTPKIVKTKHDEITMRDFTSMFPPFSISIQAFPDLRCYCGDKKQKLRKQKPRKSRLLSSTKGEENRIEL